MNFNWSVWQEIHFLYCHQITLPTNPMSNSCSTSLMTFVYYMTVILFIHLLGGSKTQHRLKSTFHRWVHLLLLWWLCQLQPQPCIHKDELFIWCFFLYSNSSMIVNIHFTSKGMTKHTCSWRPWHEGDQWRWHEGDQWRQELMMNWDMRVGLAGEKMHGILHKGMSLHYDHLVAPLCINSLARPTVAH